MKIPNIFVPTKDLEGEIKRLLKKEKSSVQPKYSKFEVISANTYAEGVAKLKEQGRKPFAFVDNVEARIADYEANGKDAELFDTWLSSVTGIAYKANSTKFKLILRSDKLENITDLGQDFVSFNYDAEQGLEFDNTKCKYNQDLTREEAKNHEFWLAAIGGDKEKLNRYVDIWFDKTGLEEGMCVCLRKGIYQDELRALTLNDDYLNSEASDHNYLFSNPRFISSTQHS